MSPHPPLGSLGPGGIGAFPISPEKHFVSTSSTDVDLVSVARRRSRSESAFFYPLPATAFLLVIRDGSQGNSL